MENIDTPEIKNFIYTSFLMSAICFLSPGCIAIMSVNLYNVLQNFAIMFASYFSLTVNNGTIGIGGEWGGGLGYGMEMWTFVCFISGFTTNYG